MPAFPPSADQIVAPHDAVPLDGDLAAPFIDAGADYVAWAKVNPKDADFGSPAAGATPHFVGTMLGGAAGVPLNHIPFKGGAPLVSDLLGGQVQSGVNVLPEVLPHANSGKLRILAVSGAKRSRYLPNVPTFAESGFKDVAADEYFAVFVPSKTPPDVVAKLNTAIRTALKAKPMIDGLEKLSFDLGGESPAEFRQDAGPAGPPDIRPARAREPPTSREPASR